MAVRDLDAVFFVQHPPVLELVDGMFHVCYDIGKSARFEIVLPPSAFFKALRQANKLSDLFHQGGKVVPLRAKKG